MDVAKIVVNACYGGFSLSTDACCEYLRRTGQDWTEEDDEWSIFGEPHIYVAGNLWTSRTLSRTDPTLIAIVEEWGERANGPCAWLEIETLPRGTQYRIEEYDGIERIETRDQVDWATA